MVGAAADSRGRVRTHLPMGRPGFLTIRLRADAVCALQYASVTRLQYASVTRLRSPQIKEFEAKFAAQMMEKEKAEEETRLKLKVREYLR